MSVDTLAVSRFNMMMERKEEYLVCARVAGKYDEIYKLYKELRDAYMNYHRSLCDAVAAAAFDANAHKPKADPYIMGGLASGIGGVGAGLYAASETAANNAKIDDARAYYSAQSAHKQEVAKIQGNSFRSIVDSVWKKMNALPDIDKADKYFSRRKAIETKIEKLTKEEKNITESKGNDTVGFAMFACFGLGSVIMIWAGVLCEIGFFTFLGVAFALLALCCLLGGIASLSDAKKNRDGTIGNVTKELETAKKELEKYKKELDAWK